jgi:AcrR family transcriptional regulator
MARAVVKRPRGRPKREPSAEDRTGLTREVIIAKAAALTQSEPLTEISMVRLARDFGVAPGLIHYYVGSRDELVSGVLNLYFRDRVARMRAPTGDWREDLREIARTTMATMLQYRGVAAYISSHNRYRLFQKVLPGETDYGLEFFNIFAATLQRGGLSPKTAATGYHLIMQYLVSCSMIEIGRQMPGEHRAFIRQRLAGLEAEKYSGALYIAAEFSQLNFAETFEVGLDFLISGLEKLDGGAQAELRHSSGK